jgi:hypothetical protein
MRPLWNAIAAPAVLLTAAIASGQGVASGVTPPRPGYEPLPFAYGPAHGFKPHAAYPIAAHDRGSNGSRGVAHDRVAPSTYRSPPGDGSNPEYGLPPRTYDPLPYAMQQDPNARFKAWNEIADSLTEALLQGRQASSHDHSRFTSQFPHATRPR